MSESIEEILKKIKANTSIRDNSATEIDIPSDIEYGMAGDPNCPHCGGLGYVRMEVPVGHPDFGKAQVCVCRRGEVGHFVRQRLYALSQLNELSHLTFENFDPRGHMGLGEAQANSLELAYNQSLQFAQAQQGWLLLQGDYGSGKTHLAAAIANFAVDLGIPTIFLTVPDLLDTLRFTYQAQDETFEERFEEIRRIPMLILDDFGTQNATGWAQEKLFQIINYRYINRLPLVVTTNLSIEQIEGRLRSRLLDPELITRIHILAPDFRRPTDDVGHHELSSLHLHGGRTFGNFDLRKDEKLTPEESKSLERAFSIAKKFAEKPKGWLVFTGPYGSGKTHLAAAIANYQAGLGNPPLFVMVPDLLDHLRATFSPNSLTSYDRRFDEIRTSSLLILDDLGTQSMTPWVREKLYQLFNYRYNAELPTVITSADPPENSDPRIRSRMEDARLCEVLLIKVSSYKGMKKK